MTGRLIFDNEILVDEIGLRTARYRDVHIKSAYQPVWRFRDGVLRAQSVEAFARVFREGVAVPAVEFLAQVAPEERFYVEWLCQTLHLENYPNIGASGVELFFNYDPGVNTDLDRSVAQLGEMAERLGRLGIDAGLLVCEITQAETVDRDTFVRLAAEIRRLGMRLAIDGFGVANATLDHVRTVAPEFVKFDGAFLRRVMEEPAALHLLSRLSNSLKAAGALVIFEGLETPAQLVTGIETGADYLQGFLLGKPALAGSHFDDRPWRIEHFTGLGDRVVPLYAAS